MRRRFASFTAALAVAGLVLLPSAALADRGPDTARGNVHTISQRLHFSARSTQTGLDASGHARLTLTGFDPDLVFAGEVTCLRVVGATATTPVLASIGVRITQQPPGLPFQSIVINASDSGRFSGAPDTASSFLSFAPPPSDGACPAPVVTTPVADGWMRIHNTLP